MSVAYRGVGPRRLVVASDFHLFQAGRRSDCLVPVDGCGSGLVDGELVGGWFDLSKEPLGGEMERRGALNQSGINMNAKYQRQRQCKCPFQDTGCILPSTQIRQSDEKPRRRLKTKCSSLSRSSPVYILQPTCTQQTQPAPFRSISPLLGIHQTRNRRQAK
jgi:hypothetical protein